VIRALIIQQERASPGGFIREWLEERGAEVESLRIDVDDRDVDPTQYDLLVPLGSEHAPYADHISWIPREVDLLRRAYDADVSVLGICFGGQLLARSLGARCYRARAPEIGWLPVTSRDPDLVPEGPWFQWHFDTFEAPEGSTVIAESDVGPQAFVVGRSLGVQFHPEVTPEIMEEWVRVYRHELDADGVDPDRLLAETHSLDDSARAMARRLLDTFLERVARKP
jgi:GMP synthase-like glutamine amidotransferase